MAKAVAPWPVRAHERSGLAQRLGANGCELTRSGERNSPLHATQGRTRDRPVTSVCASPHADDPTAGDLPAQRVTDDLRSTSRHGEPSLIEGGDEVAHSYDPADLADAQHEERSQLDAYQLACIPAVGHGVARGRWIAPVRVHGPMVPPGYDNAGRAGEKYVPGGDPCPCGEVGGPLGAASHRQCPASTSHLCSPGRPSGPD